MATLLVLLGCTTTSAKDDQRVKSVAASGRIANGDVQMSKNDRAQPAKMEFAPEVAALLAGTTPQSRLGQSFVRFAESLTSGDESLMDQAETPDAQFHELDEMGLPPGPAGLKIFRRQMNAAFPDQRAVIVAMRFEGSDIIETELDATATHLGEVMAFQPQVEKFISAYIRAIGL